MNHTYINKTGLQYTSLVDKGNGILERVSVFYPDVKDLLLNFDKVKEISISEMYERR